MLEVVNHKGRLTPDDMHAGQASFDDVGRFSLPIYGASLLKGKSQQQVDTLRLQELKNGRVAMLGTHI